MSSDSTELTFVRCPSCRSLVPAVSTRCRMCGAKLDTASGQEERKDTPPKPKRVRQRTMSDTSVDFAAAIKQIREDTESDTQAEEESPVLEDEQEGVSASSEGESEDYEDDESFLEDYLVEDEEDLEDELDEDEDDEIEDLEDEHEEEEEELESTSDEYTEAKVDEDFSDDEGEDPLGDYLAQLAEDEESEEELEEDAPWLGNDEDDDIEDGLTDSDDDSDVESEVGEPVHDNRSVAVSAMTESVVEKPEKTIPMPVRQETSQLKQSSTASRMKVFLEPGGKRSGGRSGGLSFSKKNAGSPSLEPEALQMRASSGNGSAKEAPVAATSISPVMDEPPVNIFSAKAVESMPVSKGPALSIGVEKPIEERRPQYIEPQNSAVRIETVKPKAGPRSRLKGWLVSYSDESGSSIELREGKFFVTRDSIKSGDLIIDHESISTPHALVIINDKQGVCMQDLMSDTGVFLKREGSSEYNQEMDSFRLQHGDWVRFGEVEFLISIIPEGK